MNILSQDFHQLKLSFTSKIKWIILSYLVALLCCGIIFWKTPRQYTVKASFLVFENQADALSIDQFSNILKVQKLNQNTLQQLVLDFLLSERIRVYTAQQMQPLFQSEIDRLIAEKKLGSNPESIQDYILGNLKCGQNMAFFQRFPSSATYLYYTHPSPTIALATVQHYLDYLQIINEELGLTARKRFIVELDPPQVNTKTTPDMSAIFFAGLLIVTLFWSAYFSATLALASLEESSL